MLSIINHSGFYLHFVNSETPVFVNNNVWHSVDDLIKKEESQSIVVQKQSLDASEKLYNMLSYSSKPYNNFLDGRICDRFIRRNVNDNPQYYQPLTSHNQIIVKNKNPDKPNFFVNDMGFARKQIQLKYSERKENMVMLKMLEDSSTNDKDPIKGILKLKNSKESSKSNGHPKTDQKKLSEEIRSDSCSKNISKKKREKKISIKKKSKVLTKESVKPKSDLFVNGKIVELFPFKLKSAKKKKKNRILKKLKTEKIC